MILQFQFEATDELGRPQSGRIEAADRAAARGQLISRGWTVLSLESAMTLGSSAARPLAERDVVELLEQLALLTRSHLPLPAGLRAASVELESAPLRAAFLDLATHLEQGRGLDAALLAEAHRFPAHLHGLVLAGARSGRLADLLAEVVQGSNLGHELRRQVWGALAYPALVLAAVVGLTVFICRISAQVIDRFLLDNFTNVSPMTSVATSIFALTKFFAEHDLAILTAGLVTGIGGWLIWGFLAPPAARRRFLESLPLLGPMAQFVALAEFCHLAALLVELATPLPEAIRLAGASVGNSALAEDSYRVAASVARGESLSTALQGWSHLPAGLGQLLAWGEGEQNLSTALRFAGDMFEARAATQATFARQVFGASLFLLVFWWIGFAIASVYLPVTYSIRSISVLSG